jgi:hypothetical protein
MNGARGEFGKAAGVWTTEFPNLSAVFKNAYICTSIYRTYCLFSCQYKIEACNWSDGRTGLPFYWSYILVRDFSQKDLETATGWKWLCKFYTSEIKLSLCRSSNTCRIDFSLYLGKVVIINGEVYTGLSSHKPCLTFACQSSTVSLATVVTSQRRSLSIL